MGHILANKKTILDKCSFPTLTCGVFVFSSVSAPSSRPPPSSLTHSSHTHSLITLTHSFTHSLTCACTYIHIHTNAPTITPPSLLYFLFPSCFSMLSLSLEKLVTCGVIRSYNVYWMILNVNGGTVHDETKGQNNNYWGFKMLQVTPGNATNLFWAGSLHIQNTG